MGNTVGTEGLTRIMFDNGVGDKSARVSADNPLPVDIGGSTPGNPSGGVTTVQFPEAGATFLKTIITMSGVSDILLAADPTRSIVLIVNAANNSFAVIDISNGTAALDEGIPLLACSVLTITGKAAQQAMTQIGTVGQKLTVYTG